MLKYWSDALQFFIFVPLELYKNSTGGRYLRNKYLKNNSFSWGLKKITDFLFVEIVYLPAQNKKYWHFLKFSYSGEGSLVHLKTAKPVIYIYQIAVAVIANSKRMKR